VFYSGVALILTLIVAIPAGYALAHLEFRGRKTVLISTLIIMFVPTSALVLPTFLELSAIGLVGTAWSVILPFTFFPFGVYLAFIYFSTSIPPALIQAARIDGCTDWQVFRHIAVPLSIPIIGLVGFFGFVANWNNYFLPFIMEPQTQQMPIQVGLANLISSVETFNPTNVASTVISLPQLALATLISVAPVLIVFLFSQRFLVTGLTAGATKG
jgi:multiple sugar transport system permease protein